jgi:hypothetical protein
MIVAGLGLVARLVVASIAASSLPAPTTQVPDSSIAGHARLISATLSTGTPRLGERFELTVIARIPPDHTVRFPDSLRTGTGVESISAPVWSTADVQGDSIEITIVYPLRGMAWGRIAVPETELIVERAAGSVTGGELVTPWTSETPAAGTFSRRPITPAWVEVPQVLPPAGPNGGFRPMPAFDVVGSEWGPARIGLVSLLGVVCAWISFLVFGVIYRRVVTPLARAARLRRLLRARAMRGDGIPPRVRALAELDELLASDLDRAPRLSEYYARGTRSARGYLGSIRGPTALARTYRELIADLFGGRDRGVGGGASEVPPLEVVLRRAESVRFGGEAASAGETREDLLALRDWVSRYPPEDVTP